MQLEADETPEAKLLEAAMGNRSTMFRWMRRNHDEFRQILGEAGRADWDAIAAYLGELGLTDKNQRAPTKDCARGTWRSVQKLVKEGKKKAKPKPRAPQGTKMVGTQQADEGPPYAVFGKVRARKPEPEPEAPGRPKSSSFPSPWIPPRPMD